MAKRKGLLKEAVAAKIAIANAAELERMNKLMVDREVRMIELKDENEEYKKKLGLS